VDRRQRQMCIRDSPICQLKMKFVQLILIKLKINKN
jgi:hypothetical protein